jgi:SPP1 family predicted phage head-tail adaptor
MNRESKKTLTTRKRHGIYVQTKTSVDDCEGGFIDTWTSGSLIWAEVSPMQAKQVFQYKSISVDATHLIRVDGYVEVPENSRILFDGRYFEVLVVENIQELDFEKVITCKEMR